MICGFVWYREILYMRFVIFMLDDFMSNIFQLLQFFKFLSVYISYRVNGDEL